MMNGPLVEADRLQPAELVPLYLDLVAAHTNDPALGVCPICRQSRCDEWRRTYGHLFGAGELTGAHERWRDLIHPDAVPEQGKP